MVTKVLRRMSAGSTRNLAEIQREEKVRQERGESVRITYYPPRDEYHLVAWEEVGE